MKSMKKYLNKVKMHNLSTTLAKETMTLPIPEAEGEVTKTRNRLSRPRRSKGT